MSAHNVPACVALGLDQRKLPAETFERIVAKAGSARRRRERNEKAFESFGKPGRDPGRLGGVLDSFATTSGWKPYMRLAELNSDWDKVVGEANARNSRVIGLRDGVLTVCTRSPAWTVTLQGISPQILEKVQEKMPELHVEHVNVVGPVAHRKSRYSHRH